MKTMVLSGVDNSAFFGVDSKSLIDFEKLKNDMIDKVKKELSNKAKSYTDKFIDDNYTKIMGLFVLFTVAMVLIGYYINIFLPIIVLILIFIFGKNFIHEKAITQIDKIFEKK